MPRIFVWVLILVSLFAARTAAAGDCPVIGLQAGRDSQQCQNEEADRSDLDRLGTLPQLQRFIRKGWLVRFTNTDAYTLDPDEIGEKDEENADSYAYGRPWTKALLDRELAEIHRVTGETFEIISLVRTATYQGDLKETNERAIRGRGHKRSSHLTGATVDIRKKGRSAVALKMLRERLIVLEEAGLIEAIEEKKGRSDAGCFHVMVFRKYGDGSKAPAFDVKPTYVEPAKKVSKKKAQKPKKKKRASRKEKRTRRSR